MVRPKYKQEFPCRMWEGDTCSEGPRLSRSLVCMFVGVHTCVRPCVCVQVMRIDGVTGDYSCITFLDNRESHLFWRAAVKMRVRYIHGLFLFTDLNLLDRYPF